MGMRAVKAVKQNYSPTPEVLTLLETFRAMLNECIRIGLEANVTSMKSLSLRAYPSLAKYDAPSRYRLTAISAATGILRNHRKAKRKKPKTRAPCARKLMLTTCYGFKIEGSALLLPIRTEGRGHPASHISIPLTSHTVAVLAGFDVRSVTLTARNFSIAYSKEAAVIEPHGLIGVDRNLNNVTTADTNGHVEQLDLSEATRIKAQCRETKRHLKRNDARVRRQVYGKYGRIQYDKVQQILHHASKQIVQEAKRAQHGIVMEDLKDIRKLYRKGNWQGKEYRAKLNGWSYGELQRQIQYKAQWEGVPVIYVSPYGTSSRCAKCGLRMKRSRKPEERRIFECSVCGFTVDRDVNAAMNLVARGMRFVPIAPQAEAMVAESIHQQVIRQVDCGELTKLKLHEPTS